MFERMKWQQCTRKSGANAETIESVKAESDGSELKLRMFGPIGISEIPEYEPPSRKKTLSSIQQVLIIHHHNPRMKWEILRAAVDGK